MNPEDANFYAPNIKDRNENHPDNLKADINCEPDDRKRYINLVAEIHEEKD